MSDDVIDAVDANEFDDNDPSVVAFRRAFGNNFMLRNLSDSSVAISVRPHPHHAVVIVEVDGRKVAEIRWELAQLPIPVTERLPEAGVLCLAYCRKTQTHEGVWSAAVLDREANEWTLFFSRDQEWDEFSADGNGFVFSVTSGFVTHWLPKFPAPKE